MMRDDGTESLEADRNIDEKTEQEIYGR